MTTRGAFVQALAIGPIFSAAFLTGTVALVLYGRHFAGAGGVHEYLRRGVHPSV